MVMVSSWGRLGAWPHQTIGLTDRNVVSLKIQGNDAGIAYGMGRSYGDVCLNPGGMLWQTTGLDRFIHFDDSNGRLTCEAGVLLRDIQRMAIPRGWMLAVTPGTQFVTVGGAIANDVHGKNHHAMGSFGNHVTGLKLVRTDGSIIECSPERMPDWFCATVGGLGLTGVITEAEIQLHKISGPWLSTETLPYRNLKEFFQLTDESAATWEYTVSWIDCMAPNSGRGLFMRAKHSTVNDRPEPHKRERNMPVVPPVSLINPATLRPLNTVYFHLKKRDTKPALAHYESFFYPLDKLLNWNRMYGHNGFYQYQCVVPQANGIETIQALLDGITASGEGSFLAVLKTFGARESVGMISFPQAGVTLAVDFPNQGERTLRLFTRLDAIVREAGGRLYAAKDARMPHDLFEAGYPRLAEFLRYRDPGISSAFSRRILGK